MEKTITTDQAKEKVKKLISELANDFKPLVESTEKKLATTQNHYGDYMAIIGQFSKGNRNMAKVISMALMEAGANRQGVTAAMQFC